MDLQKFFACVPEIVTLDMCDPYQTNLIGRSGKWLFKNVQLIWYESMRACMRAWDHVFYKNSGSKQHFCYGYPINAGSHICGNITTFLGMLVSPPPLSVSVAITHGRVVAYHVAPTHKVTWSFDHVIFQDLVTNLNFHYHSAYCHKTWQDGDLPCHKVTWPFNNVVLENHVTN